jgi:hypothetical protein
MTFPSGFPRSTPDSAREEITRLRASPSLTAKELALLDRLASDPIMSEVWAKLPNGQNRGGEIVRKAFDAARLAWNQGKPFPKRNRAAQRKYVLEHRQPYTLEMVATMASMMRNAMIETRHLVRPMDPELKHDELLAMVDYIESAYKAAHEHNARYWREFHCPRIRTAGAKNAAEICFSKMMSCYFKEQFGQPLDAVVAALAQAVFVRSKGITEEAVRERRRHRVL